MSLYIRLYGIHNSPYSWRTADRQAVVALERRRVRLHSKLHLSSYSLHALRQMPSSRSDSQLYAYSRMEAEQESGEKAIRVNPIPSIGSIGDDSLSCKSPLLWYLLCCLLVRQMWYACASLVGWSHRGFSLFCFCFSFFYHAHKTR